MNYFGGSTIQAVGCTPINDAAGLDNIRNDLTGDYCLTADIDLAGYSAGDGWEPIGTDGLRFTGTLDGAGFTISNLTINRTTQNHIGLFGSTEGATIQNVTLTDVDVTGQDFVGGLMGEMQDVEINNVSVQGEVSGRSTVGGVIGRILEGGTVEDASFTGKVEGSATTFTETGGLIGFTSTASIEIVVRNSHATADVNGNQFVGGLIGRNSNTSVEHSSAAGIIEGRMHVGGLIGSNTSSDVNTFVESSFFEGTVHYDNTLSGAPSNFGGLIGYSNSSVRNSYATGEVDGTGSESVGGLMGNQVNYPVDNSYAAAIVSGADNTGGLIGLNGTSVGAMPGVVSNSYYDQDISLQNDALNKGDARSTVLMQKQATFTGWNFTTIWNIDEGNDYPRLQVFMPLEVSSNANLGSLSISSGSLTPEFGADTLNYTANVGNEIEQVTVTLATYDANATVIVEHLVVINPTDDSYSVDLNEGDNVLTIQVTAEDETTEKTYILTITREEPSDQESEDSNGSEDDNSSPAPEPTPVPVVEAPAAQLILENVDGDILNLSMNPTILTEQLSSGQLTEPLVIKTKTESKKINLTLEANILAEIHRNNPHAVIRIQTLLGEYDFSLDSINMESDIELNIIIQSDQEQTEQIDTMLSEQDLELVSPILNYSIEAKSGDSIFNIDHFGTTYVQRTINMNQEEIDPLSLTGVAINTETGEVQFVPTVFQKVDGSWRAIIQRNSNSSYAIIQHQKTFDDITTHWAKEEIELLASKLIIKGMTKELYAPDQTLTRAEFATLLVRSLGLNEGMGSANDDLTFSDVASKTWYAGAVSIAVQAGLIQGYNDGTFRPNQEISREELAVLMNRALHFVLKNDDTINVELQLAKYEDGNTVASWAKEDVASLIQNDIFKGLTSSSIAPKQQATRAEAAFMLKRLLQRVEFINE